MEPTMKDSGQRRTFETGAVRDRGQFKPRPDLISPHANLREGAWLAKGAEKYAVDNWCKGIPIRECIASLTRHLEAYKLGRTDEDHMAAIRTNAGFILHYEEEIKAGRLPASLDDMPHYLGRKLVVEYTRGVERLETVKTVRDCPVPPAVEQTVAARLREFNQGTFAAEDIPEGAPVKIVGEGPIQEVTYIDDSPTIPVFHACDTKPPTVYLCGPITGQEVDYVWRNIATEVLGTHAIRTLNPLRGKQADQISNHGLSYKGQLASPEIADRDRMDIDEADLILAHFPYDPPRQSIGSLMEMGMAQAKGKPVVLCTRLKTFNEHLFCRNFCVIMQDFDKALEYIAHNNWRK